MEKKAISPGWGDYSAKKKKTNTGYTMKKKITKMCTNSKSNVQNF